MVGRYNLGHSVESLLQLGAPYPKEINELLGIATAATRPKSSAFTTCEDYAIIVYIVFYHNSNLES